MNKYLHLLFLILLLISCKNPVTTTMYQPITIIPAPAHSEKLNGQFTLATNLTLQLPSNVDWRMTGQRLIDQSKKINNIDIELLPDDPNSDIILEYKAAISSDEGHELDINPKQIIIRAKEEQGAFYGVQSLIQLIYNNKNALPCVHIEDAPRFSWRGTHLDVSRHFFGVEIVKKYIDLLALHKMNYFHWHLTDDQGWRIEIKKYPKLTSIGAFRDETLVGHYNDQPHQFDGKRYGGFYTQEQIKEVVQYAKERFVTVVPEIELPGHAQAALSAYPELGCEDVVLKPLQIWGVSNNIFCPEEATFTFLENVLDEVIALFPGKYIHVGGDECPKVKWEESAFCQKLMKAEGLRDGHELQSYFIQRIEKYVNSKGKQIIGWDEILEGGLAPNATVMSWQGIEGGIAAAKEHHDVIMTPTSHCYFDYYQSDHPEEPLAIGGLIPLQKVYDYEPIPDELTPEQAKYILGTQANIWTEYMPTSEKLDYMAFPRICALAEVAWLPKENKNFSDFVQRLIPHIKLLRELKVNTANHLYEIGSSVQATGKGVLLQLNTIAPDAEIRYTRDGSEPTQQSLLYKDSVLITESTGLSVLAFSKSGDKSRMVDFNFDFHLAAGKNITLTNQPHPKYIGGGNGSIINGLNGSDERYGDSEWLGFEGTDFEAVIDLRETRELQKVGFRFFKGEGQWIYLPKLVKVLTSDDGTIFTDAASLSNINGDKKVVEVSVSLKNPKARYVKVIAENYGIIPKGSQGAGSKAWLFVDEIKVY